MRRPGICWRTRDVRSASRRQMASRAVCPRRELSRSSRHEPGGRCRYPPGGGEGEVRRLSPRPCSTTGLSQRALIAVSAGSDDVADLDFRPPPLHARSQRPSGPCPGRRARGGDQPSRPRHPHRPACGPRARRPAPGRDGLAARTYRRVDARSCPVYRSDRDAADALDPFCNEIGSALDHGLAACRYVHTPQTAARSTALSFDFPDWN